MFLAQPAFSREIHAYHQASLPQRENGCGAFALTCLLRGLGWATWEGREITPDLTAYLAGMVALEDGYPFDADSGTFMQHRWGFLRAYDYRLRRSDDVAAVGTGPEGLVRATETLTGNTLSAMPVRGRTVDGSPLSPSDLWAVVDCLLLPDHAPWEAQVVFNYQAGHLAALEGPGQGWSEVLFGEESLPCEWDVGHMTSLAGVVAGRRGHRALVIRDNSPHFGWRGYHAEQAAAVSRALARTDGSQGGMLVLCRTADRDEVRASLAEVLPHGDFSLWDNGSVYVPPLPLP